MTLTSQMATPSSGIWAMKPTPPTQSKIAMRWVKLARNFRQSGLPLTLLMTLGP